MMGRSLSAVGTLRRASGSSFELGLTRAILMLMKLLKVREYICYIQTSVVSVAATAVVYIGTRAICAWHPQFLILMLRAALPSTYPPMHETNNNSP